MSLELESVDPELLQLSLYGHFRLSRENGTEIPIRAAKTRALLALLALSPLGRRTRTWLQDKLWSDRGRDQAAASLRQSLSQLRDELGPSRDVLEIRREVVTLNLQRIALVDCDPASNQQFLEGLDVRDPEFEAWLRTERVARLPAIGSDNQAKPLAPYLIAPRGPQSVYIVMQAAPRSTERIFEDIFTDCLECSLRESHSVNIYRRAPSAAEIDPMIMAVQVFSMNPQSYGIRVQIEQGRRRRALWSGMRMVQTVGAPPIDHQDILSLAFEATEALADALLLDKLRSKEQLDASLMARLAIRKIFMMTPAEMIQADQLLSDAFQMDPHPQFLAWRIQLRVIQQLERHSELGTTADTELSEIISRAMALDPHNSMILAATANARLLIDGNAIAGVEIARSSLRINAANPFAWDCLSIAFLMNGALEEAHRHQMRANEIASRFPIRHFWDMGACLTSVATGRTDMALRLAQSANALSPSFRPPLRYLTALHAIQGDTNAALSHAARLRQLEPDFSMERLLSDASYPVAALRRSGLLADAALRELEHVRL